MSDELAGLKEENRRLRQLLAEHQIELPSELKAPEQRSTLSLASKLSSDSKVRLFRELFRGREDVYAVRWESPDGRKGYTPKSERDWKAYNAAKPEDRQRVDRETRRYLPLTDDVVRAHLKGEIVIGIYPLLRDESCWFLAADFDKATWEYDCHAFLETCREWKVPASLERSRSGKGGHIWIFFDSAVPALVARKLGCALLTRTMERRHQIGLDSYDRFFPNQDTMPKGGFGNLIALPLQKASRDLGNSVFLDEHLKPHPDQWAFLSSVRRMRRVDAERTVDEAQRKGDLVGIRISLAEDDETPDPWTLPPSKKQRDLPIPGPFPKSVEITRANLVYVAKKGLPAAMLNRLLRIAAFQNPEFYKAQSMRLSTYDKPRVIGCGDDLPQHIALPRGSLADALELLQHHSVKATILDETYSGAPIGVEFRGILREHQAEAAQSVIAHDEGVICAPTAFGKTVLAAWLIAQRNVPSLVLVHRQQLLDQWRERLAMFLELPVEQIGQIGGGKTKRTGRIDVAVIQSLYQQQSVKDFVAEYGHIVVDECHHLSAFTFEKVMREVKARYVVGLTATPARKDGHHPIIFMQCGPIRYRMNARTMTESTPFEHVVIPRLTDFRMSDQQTEITIQDVYAALVNDQVRNDVIAADLIRAVQCGRSPLLLTGRTEHLGHFAEKLSGSVKNVFVLKGGLGRKQRREIAEQLAAVPHSEQRVILATGSYIGEGFDDARLDTLFLAMPISWKGTLQQYVGRLHRLHDNKRIVEVYDYVDANVRMLARMYERRLKGYADMGYRILDSGPRQQGLSL
jgi:superfamily II DNA or RNA helicase